MTPPRARPAEPDFFGADSIFCSVANIAIWGGVGFNMLVIYTALRAVPPELYDAARIDGCTELRLALRIKLPLIAPALVMTDVFSLIATLQVFSEPMTLEPLTNVLPSTWVAADEDLPRRVRRRRHLLRGRDLGDARRRHARAVGRSCCGSCSRARSGRTSDSRP